MKKVVTPMIFASIEQAISDIAQGKIIIVVDDENRENEGDFIMAASHATPEAVNFMAKFGRGLICTPLSREYAKRLGLDPMIPKPEDSMETAFTVTIDAKHGISTGISAADRALTIKLLADPQSTSDEFVKPGHIFPLIAKKGGVLSREGHTEAAVDLAVLAGTTPVGVICEILNDDGTCARLPELIRLAKKFEMNLITIEDLIKYQKQKLQDHKGNEYEYNPIGR